jgi:hypothetical protein
MSNELLLTSVTLLPRRAQQRALLQRFVGRHDAWVFRARGMVGVGAQNSVCTNNKRNVLILLGVMKGWGRRKHFNIKQAEAKLFNLLESLIGAGLLRAPFV